MGQPKLIDQTDTTEVMRSRMDTAEANCRALDNECAMLRGLVRKLQSQVVTWHTSDEKPSALEPVQGWYSSGPCGYAFHRIVQWTGVEWIALYDHKPCSIPERWAYLPKFETEVTP